MSNFSKTCDNAGEALASALGGEMPDTENGPERVLKQRAARQSPIGRLSAIASAGPAFVAPCTAIPFAERVDCDTTNI
jgi:hypothetical protein